MLRLYKKMEDRGAGDTGAISPENRDDVDPYLEEKTREVPEDGRYLSRDLTASLTHLTAEMEVFVGDCSTDYEDWKTVVNRIEQLEGIQYFACIRTPTGVYGKFSSVRPLREALLAVVSPERSGIPLWFEALMSIAPILLHLQEMKELEKKSKEAAMEVPKTEIVPEDQSGFRTFLARVFCCFRKKKSVENRNAEHEKIEFHVNKVYTTLNK